LAVHVSTDSNAEPLPSRKTMGRKGVGLHYEDITTPGCRKYWSAVRAFWVGSGKWQGSEIRGRGSEARGQRSVTKPFSLAAVASFTAKPQ